MGVFDSRVMWFSVIFGLRFLALSYTSDYIERRSVHRLKDCVRQHAYTHLYYSVNVTLLYPVFHLVVWLPIIFYNNLHTAHFTEKHCALLDHL